MEPEPVDTHLSLITPPAASRDYLAEPSSSTPPSKI